MGLIVTALLAEALQSKRRWHVIIDFLHRTEKINLIAIAMRNIAKILCRYNMNVLCPKAKLNAMTFLKKINT